MPRLERSPDHERLYRLKPTTVSRVLDKDEYWTVSFLRVFLEYIDQLKLDQPKRAYIYSINAPPLADQIFVDEKRGGYASRQQKLLWRAYSRAIYSSSCRATERFEDAETSLQQAFGLIEQMTEPPPWLLGQVHLRLAHLRGQQGNELLLEHLQVAEECFKKEPQREKRGSWLGDVAMLRGAWLDVSGNPGAAVEFARAMHLADRTTEAGRIRFDAAFASLLRVMVEAPYADRAAAIELLVDLRERMPKGTGLRTLYVRWSEARLRASLGLTREAATELETLRALLLKRSTVLDFALCSLDLILIRLTRSEEQEAVATARDTAALLAQVGEERLKGLLELLERQAVLQVGQVRRQQAELLGEHHRQRSWRRI